MNNRKTRGQALAASVKIEETGDDRWRVPSATGNGAYIVTRVAAEAVDDDEDYAYYDDDTDTFIVDEDDDGFVWECTCPDNLDTCKHIYAVKWILDNGKLENLPELRTYPAITVDRLEVGKDLYRVERDNEFRDRDNPGRPKPLGPPVLKKYTVLAIEPTRRGSFRIECRSSLDDGSEVHFQIHSFEDLGMGLCEQEALDRYAAKNRVRVHATKAKLHALETMAACGVQRP